MRSDWTLSRKNIRTERVVGLVGGFTAIPSAIADAVMAGVNPVHGLNAVIAGPILGALTTSSVLRIVNSGAQTRWPNLFRHRCGWENRYGGHWQSQTAGLRKTLHATQRSRGPAFSTFHIGRDRHAENR